jgi:UDP-N-acetyl-D-mannosaminuronic acid transferase (WecB/TagA/CpsF family)
MTWGVKRSVFAALPYSVQARTLLAVLTGGDPQAVIAPALTERLGLTALYRLLLDHVRIHARAPYPNPYPCRRTRLG